MDNKESQELTKVCKEYLGDLFRQATTIKSGKKLGRNDPCPCGSNKKYKKCCGR